MNTESAARRLLERYEPGLKTEVALCACGTEVGRDANGDFRERCGGCEDAHDQAMNEERWYR